MELLKLLLLIICSAVLLFIILPAIVVFFIFRAKDLAKSAHRAKIGVIIIIVLVVLLAALIVFDAVDLVLSHQTAFALVTAML